MADQPPLATLLALAPHPEGGWFRETWRADLELPADVPPNHPGAQSAGTAIYYLLGPGESSAWHVVRSAELWFWHRGGPLNLTLGGEHLGAPHELTLGADVAAGQQPQPLVPPGVWQATRPAIDTASRRSRRSRSRGHRPRGSWRAARPKPPPAPRPVRRR